MRNREFGSSGPGFTSAIRGVTFAVAFLVFMPVMALADPPAIYHSANDDGVPTPGPVVIQPNSPATLHLYIDGGLTASTGGTCSSGTGDEICGYDIDMNATGGLTLSTFTPRPGVESYLTSTTLGIVGGDPWRGTLGPVKIGDLDVQGPDAAALELMSSQAVNAALGIDLVAQSTIALVSANQISVSGDPAGGQINFTVSGVPLVVATQDVQALDEVAASLASEINNNATLAGLGITATQVGTSVYTNGVLTNVSTTDPGLTVVSS